MRRGISLIVTIAILALICVALCGCRGKEETARIGILQWTEKIDSFGRTYCGVIDGLEAKAYKEGMNLVIEYKTAEQDGELALRIAEEFVKKDLDLIVSLGTGSSLAALKATEEKRVPIVYSIVAKPRATGIIKEYNDSGRNITGVTMKVPANEQLEVVKEVFPQLMTLGLLYCTEMPQARAAGKEAAAAASEFGWTPLTVSFPKEKVPQLRDIVQD
ncbi:MAG: ABC transporter substrate binding protein [Methanoculleaceae archaeon]